MIWSRRGPHTVAGVFAVLATSALAGCGEETVVDPARTPTAGKQVSLELARGTVSYQRPGERSARPLFGTVVVPVGTVVDATHGYVDLTAARDEAGKKETARFWEGRFEVVQQRDRNGRAYTTELRLLGGDFRGCKGAPGAPPVKERHLWGDGRGNFRTRGRFGAGAVRGTRWLTLDRCKGTLTRVSKGVVVVDDFALRRRVPVTSGKQFWALSPEARRAARRR